MCVIASEMIGLREPLGLGFLVLFMAEIGKFPQMIAAMITIGIIGIGINYLLSQIESRWFRWQEKIV